MLLVVQTHRIMPGQGLLLVAQSECACVACMHGSKVVIVGIKDALVRHLAAAKSYLFCLVPMLGQFGKRLLGQVSGE
jgi:hypothetical protein